MKQAEELNPSRVTIQALRIVQKEIELVLPGGDGEPKIQPFKGKHGKLVEMYVAMMILEHVIAYLHGGWDD